MMLLSPSHRILFFYLLLISSTPVWAAKWELTPSISASYTYSDNISLSQTNHSGDAALTASPQIQVKAKGGHLDLEANYGMQVIRYRDNTQANDVYNTAGLAANFKLVPETFNVETSVRYGQQAISLTASPAPQNNVIISSNRTNTLTYQIKPVYKSRLGGLATLQADYSYQGLQYDNKSIQHRHVINSSYHVGLTSTRAYRDLSWSINHKRSDYDVQDNSNNYDSSTELGLNYRISSKLSLIASGGDEQNHVTSSQLGTGGTYWSGGFSWTPTSHTSVEVTHGKRFFGDSTSAAITRVSKRSRFNLTYNESLTTTSLVQSNTSLIPGYVVLAIVDDFILQKALYATLSANTARTDYGMTANQRKLTYQTSLKTEEYTAYSLFWNWRFTKRSSLHLSGTRQTTNFITTQEQLVTDSHEVSLEHSLGKYSSSSLRYINYKNESLTGTNEYTSNFYEFTLKWTFR